MQSPSASSRPAAHARSRTIPAELVTIASSAAGVLAVTASGAAISALLPDPASPWLFAAAYGAPAAAAFAVYWWIAQKL